MWCGYSDMKFDYMISNPPYEKQDLKILDAVFGISDKICFIHPGMWLYNNRELKVKTQTIKLKEKIAPYFSNCEIVNNASELFGISGVSSDIFITIFDKTCTDPVDITSFDVHGNSDIYKSIKQKVLHYCKCSSLDIVKLKQTNKDSIEVGIPKMVGDHQSRKVYTMIQKTNIPSHISNDATKYLHKYSFVCNTDAANFVSYLLLKLTRFCLSVHKFNNDVILSSVPYMPTYTHEWTDEMVAKELGLTDEELKWAINWIPDYYPEDAGMYAKYYDPEQKERYLINEKVTYGGHKPL